MPHFTDTQLKAALKKNMGTIVLAAQELGVTRQAVHARINGSEEFQAFLADLDEDLLDAAEAVVADAILKRDKQMTRWFLERKGRGRGWVTKIEATGKDGAPLVPSRIVVQVQYIEPGDQDAVGDVV